MTHFGNNLQGHKTVMDRVWERYCQLVAYEKRHPSVLLRFALHAVHPEVVTGEVEPCDDHILDAHRHLGGE